VTALRRSGLVRWIIALLLLAALAWGLGQLRSDRGAKPELGVGDLRGAAAEQGERTSDASSASAAAPAAAATAGAPDPAADGVATGER
jgi:hypothetical protein